MQKIYKENTYFSKRIEILWKLLFQLKMATAKKGINVSNGNERITKCKQNFKYYAIS